MRRTFASLLYEAEASPAYVMAQMGHTSSALALEIYARTMERNRDTGERMDALLRGTDWARMGTSDAAEGVTVPLTATRRRVPRLLERLPASGRYRVRTSDLLRVKQALYQLS